ncbi:MAG: hypothetical protein AAF386_12350, partial [Pseudomonadota bacterium]
RTFPTRVYQSPGSALQLTMTHVMRDGDIGSQTCIFFVNGSQIKLRALIEGWFDQNPSWQIHSNFSSGDRYNQGYINALREAVVTMRPAGTGVTGIWIGYWQ